MAIQDLSSNDQMVPRPSLVFDLDQLRFLIQIESVEKCPHLSQTIASCDEPSVILIVM